MKPTIKMTLSFFAQLEVRTADKALPAGQVDTVVVSGQAGVAREFRHTTHGFRYVRVEGETDEVTSQDMTGALSTLACAGRGISA